MSMKQIGAACLFPGTPDETWGYCESQDISPEAEKSEIKDGSGDTKGVLFTDVGKKKFDGTYTPLATAGTNDPPKLAADDLIGKTLTVHVDNGTSTLTIVVETASFKRKKGDVSEFSIGGYYYPELVTSGGAMTSGGAV